MRSTALRHRVAAVLARAGPLEAGGGHSCLRIDPGARVEPSLTRTMHSVRAAGDGGRDAKMPRTHFSERYPITIYLYYC